jgi:hypothetical protein
LGFAPEDFRTPSTVKPNVSWDFCFSSLARQPVFPRQLRAFLHCLKDLPCSRCYGVRLCFSLASCLLANHRTRETSLPRFCRPAVRISLQFVACTACTL